MKLLKALFLAQVTFARRKSKRDLDDELELSDTPTHDLVGFLRAAEKLLLSSLESKENYFGSHYSEALYDDILRFADNGELREKLKAIDSAHPLYKAAVDYGLVKYKRSINHDYNCDDTECDVPLDLRGVWNYGCYCNFGSELTTGKGAPVNAEDSVCKRMQLCLRCAELDAQEGGYLCDTKSVTYNSTLGQSSYGMNTNANSFNSGCQLQNPNDPCAAHVCTCEMQLINEFLQIFWSGKMHDPSPRHPDNPYGGSFDQEATCVTTPGVTERDCCGKYPFRWTFNSVVKECCEAVQEIYNPLNAVCCADGVKAIGGGCA